MWALKVSVMDEIGLAVVYKIRSVVDRKGKKSHMWDTALSVMWLWEYLEEKLFGNGIVYHIKSWTDIIRGVGNMESPDDFHISHFNGAERTETQLERRECIKDAAERDTDIEKSWDTFLLLLLLLWKQAKQSGNIQISICCEAKYSGEGSKTT